MITIKLRHDLEAYVDDEDWKKEVELEGQIFKIKDLKWYAMRMRNTHYCRATIPGSGGKKVYLHRIVIDASDDMMVDHIDRNGLNDQKSNLREVTNAENQRNKESQGGSSQYKGVYKGRSGWTMEINTGTKRGILTITGFNSEIGAAKHYDKLAKKYHGEHARINFTEE